MRAESNTDMPSCIPQGSAGNPGEAGLAESKPEASSDKLGASVGMTGDASATGDTQQRDEGGEKDTRLAQPAPHLTGPTTGGDGFTDKGRQRLIGKLLRSEWAPIDSAKARAIAQVSSDLEHRSARVRAAAARNLLGMSAQNIRLIELEASILRGETAGATVNVQVSASVGSLASMTDDELSAVAARLAGRKLE